jgi:hypothetical protein
MTDPYILIGWRIFVPPYGNGIILSVKRRTFMSARFAIDFENLPGKLVALPLKHGRGKGNVKFSLITKAQ